MALRTNCEGATRRDCLRLGMGGLLGGGLVGALRATASGAATGGPRRQATSCILIGMDGGPTHYETFDPKPDVSKSPISCMLSTVADLYRLRRTALFFQLTTGNAPR